MAQGWIIIKKGNIDILGMEKRRLSFREKAKIRIAFWDKFGEQKIDIVSFKENEQEPLKSLPLKRRLSCEVLPKI